MFLAMNTSNASGAEELETLADTRKIPSPEIFRTLETFLS